MKDIFLKIHTRDSTPSSYERWKFFWALSKIKSAFNEDQFTASAASQLPLARFSWKLVCLIPHTLATRSMSFAAILQKVRELYMKSKCTFPAVSQTLLEGLTFICPCLTNIFPNYNQQDATFLDLFISTDALHVSGGSFAHHQEHKTVHKALGIVNQYCC